MHDSSTEREHAVLNELIIYKYIICEQSQHVCPPDTLYVEN